MYTFSSFLFLEIILTLRAIIFTKDFSFEIFIAKGNYIHLQHVERLKLSGVVSNHKIFKIFFSYLPFEFLTVFVLFGV